MGNYFSTETIYPEVLNQEGLKELKSILGTVESPKLENNPNPISDELFNTDCALSNHLDEISVTDPEFLNDKLKFIAEFVKQQFETSPGDKKIFPDGDEDMEFQCGHLSLIKPGNYQDFQTKELEKKFPEEVGNIKKLFRGFSVYRFNDDSLSAISRIKMEDLENVYLGLQNGSFMLFNPVGEFEFTNCLKICWWGYLLNDDSFHLFPGTGGGVTLNENGTLNTMDLSGLREIENWMESGSEEALKKFERWQSNMLEKGQVQCLVDGEQVGDLIEFTSFLETLDTKDEVFEEDE